MNRVWLAAGLSLAVLGVAWAQDLPIVQRGVTVQESADQLLLHPVKFDGSGEPRIPKGWKLVSTSQGRAPNETNLWFQDASGSVFMVQGFKDPNSREFLVYHYVNEIEAEK